MAELYRDRWITCTDDALRVRAYYFPWGTKTIPYRKITGLRRVAMGTFTGRMRIWGTAQPRYWASLDPKRPGKAEALILDLGGTVHPLLTPDDVDAVVGIIRERSSATITEDKAPFV
jgi:hypothetical protein